MKAHKLFNRILFPTDFTSSSMDALHYVVELSGLNEAELYFLHTYRLIDSDLYGNEIVKAKRLLEQQAMDRFKKWDDDFLKQTKLKYSFNTEVGFISDRIVSNIQQYDIDLLVLCKSIQDKMKEKSERGYNSLLKDLSCPVMLVPTGEMVKA
ncbi:MAG: universal stress protein [Fulvivirga sp.]|nr:universal stress protein [Fulvivirga sp.]